MSKVRVIANCNVGDLGLRKGKEYNIDEKDAKKYSETKMMYMKDFMITIIEKKIEKEVKETKEIKEVKKESKKKD